MDRVTVYPAEIPLTEDVLDGQRAAYIAVGHLAQLALGSQTAASGFAVTATGLQLTVDPGSVYSSGTIDGTPYGELAADLSPLVQQFISPAATSLTAPASSTSYIYATTSVVDADPVVLPFYNAADPSVTFSGQSNSGAALPTRRRNLATVAIGPSVPAGSIPLWRVVATATTVTVTAAPAAPFYTTLAAASLRICAPFDPVLAAAAGGYPKGIVLPDAATPGTFWVSMADNNTTVPGATGASWQSLFTGLAVLNGGNMFIGPQNIAGSLNVTGTITSLMASSTKKVILSRSAAYGGINSYDGSNWHYLIINDDDTAETAKGTLAFANAAQTFTETQTFEGETLVPDIEEFGGKDALNAETAEGRYVKSVPATGQTRITDLVENSDGRAVFGEGTNNTVLANLSDTSVCGTITGGYYIKTPLNDGTGRHLLEQRFVLTANNKTVVSFPIAYSDDSVVVDLTGTHVGGAGLGTTSRIVNVQDESLSATGFILDVRYVTENGNGGDTAPHPVYISACGVV